MEKRFTTASNNVETAYNFIDKDGVFQAANSNIDELTASVTKGINSKTGIIDKELTPATIKAQKVIRDFVKKYKPKKGLTLIWPAIWTHTHKGVVSKKHTKYIITGWINYN